MTPPERVWTLREATPQDAAAIGRFHAACWVDAYRGIVPDGVLARVHAEEHTARWWGRLNGGRRSTVVAERAVTGELMGLVSWGPSHDPPERDVPDLELASLYVARAHWGTGLADALVARALGAAPAQLWVYAANGRARAFYEKSGFVHDGRTQIDDATGVLECRYVRRDPRISVSF